MDIEQHSDGREHGGFAGGGVSEDTVEPDRPYGKTASIACELFASEAARQSNLTPLRTYEVEFDDGETLAAQQFTCNFGPMPVPAAATN